MLHTRFTTVAKFALAIVCSGILTAQAATQNLVGQAFPADLLNIAPSEIQGKVVLYDFWASWCPPCKASFPAMQRLVSEFGSQGFQVVAVNEDEQLSKMSRFLKRQRTNFLVIHDQDHILIKTLGVETMPSAFIVDQRGEIHSVHQGFHGRRSEDAYRKIIKLLLEKP